MASKQTTNSENSVDTVLLLLLHELQTHRQAMSSLEDQFFSVCTPPDMLEHATAAQILNDYSSSHKEHRIRIQNYLNSIVPNYLHDDFKAHFRMSRASFESVLKVLTPYLESDRKTGRPQHTVANQLLMTIWLLATPDSFRSIGDRFNFSKSAVERNFQRIVKALCAVAPLFIVWPSEYQKVSEAFKKTVGFPNVIGAIDGSHIPIKAPREYPETYINRKGWHSINLQAICDSRMMFTDCFAGYPGSVHDARVFKNSDIYGAIQSRQLVHIPQGMHIIGDGVYPVLEWIMTPYKDNGHLSSKQKQFNQKLSATRCVIERAFALLKGRFRRLKYLDMNCLEFIPSTILAACVMHNICLSKEGEELFEKLIEDGCDATASDPACAEVAVCVQENNCNVGIKKRNHLMMTL